MFAWIKNACKNIATKSRQLVSSPVAPVKKVVASVKKAAVVVARVVMTLPAAIYSVLIRLVEFLANVIDRNSDEPTVLGYVKMVAAAIVLNIILRAFDATMAARDGITKLAGWWSSVSLKAVVKTTAWWAVTVSAYYLLIASLVCVLLSVEILVQGLLTVTYGLALIIAFAIQSKVFASFVGARLVQVNVLRPVVEAVAMYYMVARRHVIKAVDSVCDGVAYVVSSPRRVWVTLTTAPESPVLAA